MKAVVIHGSKDVRVDEVPDPKIQEPTDAILKVTATAICGSDLHIYNGLIPQPRPMVLGHEFMGIVEEVGAKVTKLKRGDRVVVPFPIACGGCFFCKQKLPGHCENSNKNYGPDGGLLTEKGGALFGYTDLYGGYDGGQAQYVRVPYADVGPRHVPAGLSDEQVLFLSDILPTGYTSIDWAGLKGGETVAVFGCGPVGLMAQKSAWRRGAKRVFGLDILADRRQMAERAAGSETLDPSKDGWLEQLRAATEGRGPDVVVDAVGMEADSNMLDKIKNVLHAEVGNINVLKMAARAVRRGGVLSIVGVYGMPYDNFPIGQLFDKGVRLAMGQAPAQALIDSLLEDVVAGRLKADDIITHRLPLEKAPEAYKMFNEKSDGCVKVVMTP